MEKSISSSLGETKAIAKSFAKRILKQGSQKKAAILALKGELGSGKTTFLQGLAKGLGIREKVLSPTFVIIKKYEIPNPKSKANTKYKILNTKYFYHIDCYRINDPKELLQLGWKEIISDSRNLVAVEWADRIKQILPKGSTTICFKNVGRVKRMIRIAGDKKAPRRTST